MIFVSLGATFFPFTNLNMCQRALRLVVFSLLRQSFKVVGHVLDFAIRLGSYMRVYRISYLRLLIWTALDVFIPISFASARCDLCQKALHSSLR